MYEEISIPNSVIKQFDLTSCNAVITGGAGFLGRQFAETIAELNGNPLLIDINENELKKVGEELNDIGYKKFSSYVVDISDEKKCKEAYKIIWKENNGIDLLINGAALTKAGIESSDNNFFAPFECTDQNLWDAGLKVNLTATQFSCKIFGKKIAERGKGNIINIASDIGVISPNQGIYEPDQHGYAGVDFNSPAFYAVSKAGVIHLTKYLATYWAKKNVDKLYFPCRGISESRFIFCKKVK